MTVKQQLLDTQQSDKPHSQFGQRDNSAQELPTNCGRLLLLDSGPQYTYDSQETSPMSIKQIMSFNSCM